MASLLDCLKGGDTENKPSPGERVSWPQGHDGCGVACSKCPKGLKQSANRQIFARHPSSVTKIGSEEPILVPPSPRGKAWALPRQHDTVFRQTKGGLAASLFM